MDVEDDGLPKKIADPDNVTVCEKIEAKKCVSEVEGPEGEPKPRIVLTFRSEKSNTKSANMKIVSTEEKHEEVSPRRTRRSRGIYLLFLSFIWSQITKKKLILF